ncbi:Ig-like domain-containing protein [Pontibaca salina]|uniref:BapA prefix-like domain-containing protein n=1 Tax=Pontibaca salina TaxID=2795731 RepID=A0A934HP09_9RHOB|nr:Ig-like domain-containing protein [Pontibaca salina]MBI6629102.1 BapA prefix-like domain-containing protein [Pontibaca salina]
MKATITNRSSGVERVVNLSSIQVEGVSTIRLPFSEAGVERYSRDGGDLLIHMKSGEVIRVGNYFTHSAEALSELAFATDGAAGAAAAGGAAVGAGAAGAGTAALGGGGIAAALGALAAGAAVAGGGSSDGGGGGGTSPLAAPTDLAFIEDNAVLTGKGVPNTTVLVTDGSGNAIGRGGSVDENGDFRIEFEPPLNDGETVEVRLRDDAGNESDSERITAPPIEIPDDSFNLVDVANEADLTQHYAREATPKTDSDTNFDTVDINVLGDLIDVDISSGYPLVEFDLAEGKNEVDFELSLSSLAEIGVLSEYALIIEVKNEVGGWSRFDPGSQGVNDGILTLNLLFGLTETSGTVELRDFPAGEYRAALLPNPALISVGIGVTRKLEVTATDLILQEDATVPTSAEGNFIEGAVDEATSGLEISSVTFGGTNFDLSGGPKSITGDHGTLEIESGGDYTYTPKLDAADGETDSFTVTVKDQDGNEDTAKLNVTVNVSETIGAPENAERSANDDSALFSYFMDDEGGEIPGELLGEPSDDADIPAPIEAQSAPVGADFMAAQSDDDLTSVQVI